MPLTPDCGALHRKERTLRNISNGALIRALIDPFCTHIGQHNKTIIKAERSLLEASGTESKREYRNKEDIEHDEPDDH